MKVYIPEIPSGGGVRVHIDALKSHLADRVEFIDTYEPDALVHGHALTTWAGADVFTCHGVYPLDTTIEWQVAANRSILSSIRTAREVIAVSQWTVEEWRGNSLVCPTIIPNGVDIENFTGTKRGNFRRQHALGSGPLILWGKTGVGPVLDPAPAIELALRFPQAKVVTLLKPGTLPGAPENLIQLGEIPYAEMPSLLADIDIYLAVTRENSPLQLLEAVAAGVPVVGFAHAGSHEVLKGYTGAAWVDPYDYDSLYYAVKGSLKLGRQAGADFLRTHKLTWQDTADRTYTVYERALAAKALEQDSPRATIVITCYNKAGYIAETIKSAAAQDFDSFEIVVVDDGSVDDSTARIRAALADVPNSTLYCQPNAGVAAARNIGASIARGKYMVFLDGDDRLRPDYLRHMVPVLDADPLASVAYCDMVACEPTRSYPLAGDEYDFWTLKERNFIPCAALVRRHAWQQVYGYSSDINPTGEDWEFWLRLGSYGHYGRRVPLHLFYYTVADGRHSQAADQEHVWKSRIQRNNPRLFTPRVSVVIPVYRQVAFLRDALDSLAKQSYANFEAIVVDDGNTPDEAAAIKGVTSAYRFARYTKHERNRGLAAARNTGVSLARGEYIYPLDADDMLNTGAVHRMLTAVEGQENLFAYSDWFEWRPDEYDQANIFTPHEAAAWDVAEVANQLSFTCGILYPKSMWGIIGGYDPHLSAQGGWEDYDFVLSAVEHDYAGVRVAYPAYLYRQHSTAQMRLTAEANAPRLREELRRKHPGIFNGGFWA